jgi:hypothetical protein
MRRRRAIWIALAVIALAVMLFALLHQPDEPQYQGRYLSEWVETHKNSFVVPSLASVVGFPRGEDRRAIEGLGTNALPYYLRWLRYDPQKWRIPLQKKLPRWIGNNRNVSDWLVETPRWRLNFAGQAFQVLGSNAVSAIPELTAMMRDRRHPTTANAAINTLGFLGEPAIPVLQAALADTNQLHRWRIASTIGNMAIFGKHKNSCRPILIRALMDPDPAVRQEARAALSNIDPLFLDPIFLPRPIPN